MFCLCFAFAGNASAQGKGGGGGVDVVPPAPLGAERRADIKRLLGLMKVIEEEVKSINHFFDAFKRSLPNVPAKVWEELRQEFEAEFNAEMIVETYVPIFARHLSAADVKELIKFYESPLGKTFLEVMPRVREEAFADGYERGRRLRQRVEERLKARGYAPPET
jgi:hypothetical protein